MIGYVSELSVVNDTPSGLGGCRVAYDCRELLALAQKVYEEGTLAIFRLRACIEWGSGYVGRSFTIRFHPSSRRASDMHM